jgi:hypothetical protein
LDAIHQEKEKRMQLAINWSPEAAELFDAGEIQFNLYKCPDWPELVADAQSQQAAYIHFPLAIGVGQMPDWNFTDIHNWLEKTDTRFVNCHIIPHVEQFAGDIDLDALAELLTSEVSALVQEFGKERVIIENCPYFSGNIDKGYLVQGIEPKLFHHLIEATNCGFLLDVAHAHLTSYQLERDFEHYINALPVKHIREMHVTGISRWSNGLRGDHMPFTAPDWERLDYCIAQIKSGKWPKPDVMAFEYGGIGKLRDLCGCDKDAIAQQMPRLWEISQLLDNALQ